MNSTLQGIFEGFEVRKAELYKAPFTYKQFKGLICPTFTPMSQDSQSVDCSGIEAYASDLVSQEVGGLFLTGTAGSSVLLTVEERKSILTAWMSTEAVKNGKLRVISHVGANSIKDCIDLAKHAESVKAEAVSAFCPCYYKPKSVAEVAEFLIRLAHEVPNLPVFYYYFPGMNGLTFSVPDILELANKYAPNVIGCKYTDQKLADIERCATLGYNTLLGYDEIFSYALAAGAHGQIGITNNFAGKEYKEMYNAYMNGDVETADRLTRKRNLISCKLNETGNLLAAGIYMTEQLRGMNFGTLRYPLYGLNNNGKKMIDDFIHEFDFGCSQPDRVIT